MISLSAIVITLNEERNIGRCIESLRNVADEIVVVDSFSSDSTKEICNRLGARFIENKWEGYAAQKNFAQQQALHDFIISLDADEALSDALADSIRKIKNDGELVLCRFSRLTNYCGKWIRHGGWYPDVKIRLYDRRNCHWEGMVHESLSFPAGTKVHELKGDCYHYTFYTIAEHLDQVNKFTTLMADEAFANGKRSGWLGMILNPCVKFFRDYIIRLGFLDGYEGFVISRISAYATFLKYAKLKKKYRH